MPFRPHIAAFVPLLAIGSCDSSPPCSGAFLGATGKPVALEIIYIGQDCRARPATACGSVDIVEPPQGGKVLFIGARATNLCGRSVQMSAALRDPKDRGTLGAELRTVNLKPIADRPGWGETALDADGCSAAGIRNFANVAVCPNVNGRDVQDLDGLLEVSLTDSSGKKGTASVHVVPRCAQGSAAARAECACECSANSRAGKCTADGGGPIADWDAGPDDARCAGGD